MRDVGQRGPGLADSPERRLVVQRRKRPKLLDRRDDVGVDQRRLDEARAAVDDAMADGVRSLVPVDGAGLAALDEVSLEARGARVDRENQEGLQGGCSLPDSMAVSRVNTSR